MQHIRVRLTLKLNGDQVVDLNTLRPYIERGIVANLPAELAVDTVKVTRINEAAPAAQQEAQD